MHFPELIQNRQSVRKYSPRPVELEKITRILEAANRAPSAGNYQAFEIYVVRTPELLKTLTAATWDQKFIGEAQVALVICQNASRCQYPGADIFSLEDATIATTFAMLAITDLGLATCWIGAFAPDAVANALNLPDGHKPMAILPIGYAAEIPERTSRRTLNDLVHEFPA